MTISYPLDHPTAPGFTRVQISGFPSVAITKSPWTHASQVQAHVGKSWRAECTLPIMERAAAEEWITFFLSLNGVQGTFLLGNPAATTPRGNAGGVPKINGAHASLSSALVTDGWVPSTAGILLKGDYIQLQNRLFKVLGDVTSDGSGNATFDIWPSLREAISDNETIITQACKGTFRLALNDMPLDDIDVAKKYSVSFSAVEAV